jgi:hypothetical protein
VPRGNRVSTKEILEHIRSTGAVFIDAATRDALARRFPTVSPNRLRHILRGTGLDLDPLVEGVRQDTFQNLERTLLALRTEYLARHERGGRPEAQPCRDVVIEARRHAELAQRNRNVSDEKRRQKSEMRLWILTWLENPDAFAVWLPLRKGVLDSELPST